MTLTKKICEESASKQATLFDTKRQYFNLGWAMSKYQLFVNFQLVNKNFNGVKKQQAMLVKDGIIVGIASTQALVKKFPQVKKIDLEGKKIFPSFIECHTHTVFAGSRAEEFELRNSGVSYQEIARRGGGILSTVKKTRQMNLKQLTQISQARVNRFLSQGVSTLEIKSGYGLDLKNELKMLETIQNLKGPRIISTFLGAHAKPPKFKTQAEYLNYILYKILPVLKKNNKVKRVDIFIEKNFFETIDAKKYLVQFQKSGFDITIHANQLSNSGGARLAVELNAVSADHVIHLSDSDIKNFSLSNTVAVLLPTADLYMKSIYPPARKLIDAGASVALATDFNPGSCPSQDLMLVGLLARIKMGMTLPEVFMAYTANAARALNIQDQEGTLEVGKCANFICMEAELSDFFYSPGFVPKHDLFIRGKKILRSSLERY